MSIGDKKDMSDMCWKKKIAVQFEDLSFKAKILILEKVVASRYILPS